MKKYLAVLMVIALIAMAIAGCAGAQKASASGSASVNAAVSNSAKSTSVATASSTEKIKVGVVEPLSGGSAYNGKKQVEGIQAFVDYYNSNGGIKSLGGAQIELVVADSASDAATAATETERLINDKKVVGIVGCYNSGAGVTVASTCEKYKIPFVICNAIADKILYGATWSFRVNQYNSSDALAEVTLINDLNKRLAGSVKKCAFVIENSEFGNSIMQVIQDNLEKKTDAKIGMVEYYDVGITDFSTIFNKIKASDCDTIIVCPAYTEAVLFTNQYHEYKMTNYNLISLGYGMVSQEYINAVGAKGENLIVTTGWSYDVINNKSDDVKNFCLNFCKEYAASHDGINPDANFANGWLASGCMAAAIDKAGSTVNTDLQTALKNINVPAESIVCMFHPYGIQFGDILGMSGQNTNAFSVICQIQKGQFRMVAPDSSLKDNPIIWPQFK